LTQHRRIPSRSPLKPSRFDLTQRASLLATYGHNKWPQIGAALRSTARAACCLAAVTLASCAFQTAPPAPQDPFAPGIDPAGEAVDGAEVGHRLLAAGEYELALDAFSRAAAERGAIDGEILGGLGAANLGLGRLNQAEGQLIAATRAPEAQPEDWNNLGVLLMETGRIEEAVATFRKAFALSNGENTAIRDNLRLALEKSENSATVVSENNNNYKLVRRGSSEFVIRPAP